MHGVAAEQQAVGAVEQSDRTGRVPGQRHHLQAAAAQVKGVTGVQQFQRRQRSVGPARAVKAAGEKRRRIGVIALAHVRQHRPARLHRAVPAQHVRVGAADEQPLQLPGAVGMVGVAVGGGQTQRFVVQPARQGGQVAEAKTAVDEQPAGCPAGVVEHVHAVIRNGPGARRHLAHIVEELVERHSLPLEFKPDGGSAVRKRCYFRRRARRA